MTLKNKATSIRLADFSSAPMRAFHMSWFAFFHLLLRMVRARAADARHPAGASPHKSTDRQL